MGTLAKRLGQLSRRSLESESANIINTARANKVPGSLSLALDGTLKAGHDMKAFGLGTLASMACVERYQRFTQSMYHVYSTMEDELDKTNTPALDNIWKKYGDTLRRSKALYLDLQDVTNAVDFEKAIQTPSGPTFDYVTAIRRAGEHDRAEQGGRLIGHLFCRYFADLFGGQMLGTPYNVAISLQTGTPRHYEFAIDNRRSFIESLYEEINNSGKLLTNDKKEKVVNEALLAFRHNIHVYTEEPITWDAAKGAYNVVVGYGASFVRAKQ